MISVKSHLADISRVKNPTKSRYGFLRLDKNENTIPLPESLVKKIREEITPEFLMVYPEIDPLYEKIAQWLHCQISNLYLASGSDGAIKTIFETYVSPGDTVMILDPTYAMFYVYIKLFQASLSPIKYGPGLTLSKEDILNQMRREKPRLVCIANPNSPTGTVLRGGEIEEIVALGRDLQSVVMIDEAYGLYWHETAISLISQYPNLVVTRSFSKAVGLAAVRLGLAAGHPEIISTLHTFRPMYETNAFAVRAAQIVLDHSTLIQENVKKTLEGRDFLEVELKKMGIPFYKSNANFMNIRVGSPEKSVSIVKRLFDKKILIAGGFKDENLKDCIRVSIGSVEQMGQFLQEFRKALQ